MKKKNDTSRGVLLIALGSPQYGCYAANLAASIRYNDPGLPIHLVHTAESTTLLGAEHLALFTSHTVCPLDAYVSPDSGTRQFIRAKTWMYELSPFEETLFIDVDALILPGHSLTELMTQLSASCHFTMQNRGCIDLSRNEKFKDYTVWCDIEEFKRHYGQRKGLFYQYQSEFAFFKKNKKNKTYFDLVRELYDRPPIPAEGFDNGIPDEYCFNIATALLHHYPAERGKVFLYWTHLDGLKDWQKEVDQQYLGFSLGGSSVHPSIRLRIKAYLNFYRQKLKLRYLFSAHNKKQWNANRKNG